MLLSPKACTNRNEYRRPDRNESTGRLSKASVSIVFILMAKELSSWYRVAIPARVSTAALTMTRGHGLTVSPVDPSACGCICHVHPLSCSANSHPSMSVHGHVDRGAPNASDLFEASIK